MVSASMKTAIAAVFLASTVAAAQSNPIGERARDVFRELVEIDTTDSSGNVTKAAEALAARFLAAHFPDADVQVVGPGSRKQNLVVRLRSAAARKPILLLA